MFSAHRCAVGPKVDLRQLAACLFLQNSQPYQALFGPKSLHLDHRFESLDGESVPSPVRRHSDAPTIHVSVPLMRSFLADEIESVAGEGCDHLSGRERTDAAVVDAHALDRKSVV